MKYTDEQIQWFYLHKDDFRCLSELTSAFNTFFGLNKTTEAIRMFYRKRKDLTPSIKRNIPILQEEIDWINAHAEKYDVYEIVEKLNAIYKNNRTKETVKDLIKRGKIKKILSSRKGQIKIGDIRIMKCGIKAIITAVRENGCIDIKWDDGSQSEDVLYYKYKRGDVNHPLIRWNKCDDFYGFILNGVVMRKGEDVYYRVVTRDRNKEIMKMSEILNSIQG